MTRKSPQTLQGLRCLILKGDLSLLISWSSFLKRRGVQIIGTATDSLQALAIAEGESPDFALLAPDLHGTDIRMQTALALSDAMNLPVLSLSVEGRLRNISPPGWLWAQSKEFVVSQSHEGPGVLVLSRLAGTAEVLTEGALVVSSLSGRHHSCPQRGPCNAAERAAETPSDNHGYAVKPHGV